MSAASGCHGRTERRAAHRQNLGVRQSERCELDRDLRTLA